MIVVESKTEENVLPVGNGKIGKGRIKWFESELLQRVMGKSYRRHLSPEVPTPTTAPM